MTYSSIQKTDESFRLTVMWVLIAAGLVAVPFMFVHPSVTMLLLWGGMCLLLVGFVVHGLFRRAERSVARTSLKAHSCPSCGAEVKRPGGTDANGWACVSCHASFSDDGDETPGA